MATVKKSIRIKRDIAERVDELVSDGESEASVYNRLLSIGLEHVREREAEPYIVDVTLAPGSEIVFKKEQADALRKIYEKQDAPKKPGDHYRHGDVETVDFVESVLDRMSFGSQHEAWLVGNALKYACRAGYKGDWMEDARKCADFLSRYRNGEWTR